MTSMNLAPLRRWLVLALGLYAAIAAGAALAQTSRFSQVGFQASNGTVLPAYVYRATGFDPVNGAIWFVMHGAGRDAEPYLRVAAPLAERYNAMAIAIEFSLAAYPTQESYTLSAANYAEIERAFDAMRASLGGRQSGYYLFGHSAGAQFVHRLVTFLPQARVLGAVAANAGWYTLPLTDVATPYGLRGTSLERSDLRWLFAAPLTVLLGANDTATPEQDPLLRGTPEAMAQGATRLARGQYYFATGQRAAAAIAEPLKWRLGIVPQAGHNVSQMIGSGGFFLFERGALPCQPTSAAAARSLIINEILADPPTAGDANADGVRDAADDEFVELVNTGTTPLCLAGWTLGDAGVAVRHVFPLGTLLPPGRALVVFGGGIPTGRFGGAIVQWAAFNGQLSFSNAGDVLTLRDAAGAIVKQVSWGNCAGVPCASDHYRGTLEIDSSLVRSPELTGAWRPHRQVSRSLFSPGVRTTGGTFQ